MRAMGWGERQLQLLKLPVPGIPRRILKDETCFQNPGRAGGRGSGREKDCRKRNKKDEKGGHSGRGVAWGSRVSSRKGQELRPTL